MDTISGVLDFLRAYEEEPCLWNPSHKSHKNRNDIARAWARVQSSLGGSCAIGDLKKKKESLMTTFRIHLARKKQSIVSGARAEDVYTPNWFAFDAMERFLGQVDRYNASLNTENVSTPSTSHKESTSRKETTPPRVSGSHRESHRDSRSHGKSRRESNYSTQPKRIRTVESPMHFNNQTAEDNLQTPINEGQLQRELLTLARDLIKDPKEESDVIARGWSIRLNRMKPIQRVFAEKFINDILFEGELGTLHRNAVRIVPEPSAKHGNSNGNSSSSDG